MYKVTVLGNGLTVATHSIKRLRSLAIGVWAGVGGRYEPSNLSGISHFYEHIVFKGTKRRSYRQIKESIEGAGGMLNAFTSEEVTCFLSKVLAKDFSSAMDVLLDIALEPLLKTQDIEKERLVICEEIKMYYDLPHHLAFDGLLSLLWPKHPLGRNLAGSFKTVGNVSRNELVKYKNEHYRFGNMLVTACGNIEHGQVIKSVERHLKCYHQPSGAFTRYRYEPVEDDQENPQIKCLKKPNQQTQLCLGSHSFSKRDPMRYALSLMNIILGANMSSRLFNEVREKKGFAYDIGSGVKRYRDTGAFIIHAGLVNDKTEQALAVILKELSKICASAVKSDELLRAKEYFIGQLLMGLEDPMDHMLWFGDGLMCEEKIEKVEHVIEMVNNVRPKDILETARTVFTNNKLNVSLVGPVKDSVNRKIGDLLYEFKKAG